MEAAGKRREEAKARRKKGENTQPETDGGNPQDGDSTYSTKDGGTPPNTESTQPETDGGNPSHKEKSTRSRDGGNSSKWKINSESTCPSSDAGNPDGNSTRNDDDGNSQGSPTSEYSTDYGWNSEEDDRSSDTSEVNSSEGKKPPSGKINYMAITPSGRF